MIILFGTRGTSKFKGAYWGKCAKCKNTGAMSVFEATRWFTLFFIPVLPISTKYYLKCNSCFREWMSEGEERDEVQERIENGDVLEEEEFREKYKKQLQEKEKKAKEFKEKLMKFVKTEAKKKK